MPHPEASPAPEIETESESTATKATLEEVELSLIAEQGLKHSYWKTPSQLAEVVVPSFIMYKIILKGRTLECVQGQGPWGVLPG